MVRLVRVNIEIELSNIELNLSEDESSGCIETEEMWRRTTSRKKKTSIGPTVCRRYVRFHRLTNTSINLDAIRQSLHIDVRLVNVVYHKQLTCCIDSRNRTSHTTAIKSNRRTDCSMLFIRLIRSDHIVVIRVFTFVFALYNKDQRTYRNKHHDR
jgi:hypothetical protein